MIFVRCVMALRKISKVDVANSVMAWICLFRHRLNYSLNLSWSDGGGWGFGLVSR